MRSKRVFRRGDFVGGGGRRQARARAFARYLGESRRALNSGTDALILGMKALGIGPGDEVITPPNSFVASTAAIVAVGATPVFADVLPDQNIDPAAVEAAITPRTKRDHAGASDRPRRRHGRRWRLRKSTGLPSSRMPRRRSARRYDGRMSGTIGTYRLLLRASAEEPQRRGRRRLRRDRRRRTCRADPAAA